MRKAGRGNPAASLLVLMGQSKRRKPITLATKKGKAMKTFNEVNIGELFTLERKLKNNPHKPTVWRKKSSKTAWLESNKAIWFYMGKNEAVYRVSNG